MKVTPDTSASVLVVEHLSASVAGQQVVEDVSLAVPASGVTAVLGRNGVGKTSTLKALMGLYQRTGTVTLVGERIDALPTHKVARRGIGYVPEDREVFSRLTVEENLRLAERRPGADPERRALVEELFPDLAPAASRWRAPSPAASSRWSPWPGCWSTTTVCCSSTSPPRASRPAWWTRSSRRSRSCPAPSRSCSWSRTSMSYDASPPTPSSSRAAGTCTPARPASYWPTRG